MSKCGCDDESGEINTEAEGTSLTPFVETTNPYSLDCVELETATCITPTYKDCPKPCHEIPKCGPVAPCVNPPQMPYYLTQPTPQDSTKYVREYKVSGAFVNKCSFAMPACNSQLTVAFDTGGVVPIGAQLWTSAYGFLTITGYDGKGNITLTNDCPSDLCANVSQAAVGTPIPAGVGWVLTVPQCGSSSGGGGGPSSIYPYLTAGFTAPPASGPGQCINITLSTVNGISQGGNVSINGGTYYVTAVNNGTSINICNNGEGLTPGTIVDYEDSQGNLVTPVTVVNANPCDNTGTLAGKLMVCDGEVIKPLLPQADNQIPVANADGEVSYRTVAVETLDCTVLTSALTVTSALPNGPYPVFVQSTADYIPTELITIANVQFLVATIVNGTQLTVTPVTSIGSTQLYPAGTLLCSAGCCAQNSADILTLENAVYLNINPTNPAAKLLDQAGGINNALMIATGAIPLATPTNLDPVFGEITNESLSRTMIVMVAFEAQAQVQVAGTAGQFAQLNFDLQTAVTTPPTAPSYSSFINLPTAFVIPTGQTVVNGHIRHQGVQMFTVPPLGVRRYYASAGVTAPSGNASTYQLSQIKTSVSVLGVAVW